MKHTIEVNGIKLYAFHGCLPEEGKIGGNYIVDVSQTHDIPPFTNLLNKNGKKIAELAKSDGSEFEKLGLKKVEVSTKKKVVNAASATSKDCKCCICNKENEEEEAAVT